MKILVVGSINVDFITITNRTPKKGETLLGKDFKIGPGGKGANQAIAVKKLGGELAFFGSVGSDELSKIALSNFYDLNIDTKYIKQSKLPTGVANIIIEDGDNRIIVVSGANHDFHNNDFDIAILDNIDILLLQLEINTDFVYWLIEEASKKEKIIILNPAPYETILPKSIIEKVTYMTPNIIEAEQIFGKNYLKLMKDYPNKLIITKGEEGAIYYDGKNYIEVPAKKVLPIDTTGAGDTFNGALAVGLSENMDLLEAVKFAVNAATKSVEKLGAQKAIPFRKEIK